MRGPLLVVRGVSGVGWDEFARIRTPPAARATALCWRSTGTSPWCRCWRAPPVSTPDGTAVAFDGSPLRIPVGPGWLGRVCNGRGEPLDGGPPILAAQTAPVSGYPLNPTWREPPAEPVLTGVSAIDGLTTLVRGQKLPIFREGGSVTAGNASQINDGAACVVVASEERARELGREPLARIVSSASAGVDPAVMGIGPVPSTRRALERAGLEPTDIDLVELNEAFASQVLASMRELGFDHERLNVNGGAIALGHPLGCSGARLVGTLAHELRRRGARYGVATMCIGVGQGLAAVIENPAA